VEAGTFHRIGHIEPDGLVVGVPRTYRTSRQRPSQQDADWQAAAIMVPPTILAITIALMVAIAATASRGRSINRATVMNAVSAEMRR
jgi:hypothetical protein